MSKIPVMRVPITSAPVKTPIELNEMPKGLLENV